ncbi:MAG: EAL domain-containing protein [Lachnospiraceae bacterium]|nr:EAL domain-containing protein [Lachnospiraceae bacterium]
MRKRIGVLLAQLEENTQSRFMKAFMKEAYAHDYDICVFSMYQKYQETEQRNIGDSNIFSLIRFDRFDGIVIMLDTILTPGLENKLLQQVKENFHGPVVIVDRETDLFDYILMDHYSPIVELTNHLIDVHGFTDIAFLGGKEGHPHSLQRLNGFLDSMKAHGLTVREDRVCHGNFWFDSGKRFANDLIAKNDLPQAILCANDYMAIGVASVLSEHGYRIPEDIAIAGYDSNEEGRTSPVPLTSADIPAAKCGIMCFNKLHLSITGEELPAPEMKADILIGGSCGCKDFQPGYTKTNRDEWKTDHSERSYYSDFNHITEDMLCQSDYKAFFHTLAVYSYQIRPFTNYWICLNDTFSDPITFTGENARRQGYSDTMHMVIKCGQLLPDADPDAVDLDRTFPVTQMLPELDEERDYPTTFIFTPMFFEDKCFGYAVLNPGKEVQLHDVTFRIWMRNVNQGIEAFYRQKALSQLIAQIKADQVRDKQTGLYNYQGFHEMLAEKIAQNADSGKELAIIAIDIEDLRGINENYSRSGGDSAIAALSLFIASVTHEGEFCGRLSNDEFLIGIVSKDCVERYAHIISKIPKEGIVYYDSDHKEHHTFIHHEMRHYPLLPTLDLDFVINQTVNAKNHSKKLHLQKQAKLAELPEEILSKCKDVSQVLDTADLTHFFQPIVRANDGTVFGYEALMRYHDPIRLAPLDILQCATILNRLYDVQKITFNGVLDRIEAAPGAFVGKKIFVNSLPSYRMKGKDRVDICARLAKHRGQIVVEYTESSEFSDKELERQKKDNLDLDIEEALDDYGSGYSNANNLIRYCPRYVKIDRMLISDIHINAQKRHFVQSIISYAKENNIMTLAEGVETADELRCVITLGVDLIQGYYTGYPAEEPAQAIDDEVSALIRRYYRSKDQFTSVIG